VGNNKKMRNLMLILLCLGLFISCNSQNKQEKKSIILVGTKWECKITEGCTNFYEFKSDSSFIFYSCEMEDEYFGNYYLRGDTLILDQKGSIYDKDLPENSIHRTERKLYEVVIKDGKLKHLFLSDWVNGKWVKSDFKFDDSYLFKKVN
jgi:hypothetical protein